MAEKIHLVGKTFGKLTVLADTGHHISASGQKKAKSLCRCACGKELTVISQHLRTGHTKSCGCHTVAFIKVQVTTHGHCSGQKRSRTYDAYHHMMYRCKNPRIWSHMYYSSKGITVCERWKEKFENFLEDMGVCPPGLTIDRIDNDKGYCKENCKWVTWTEQMRNQSDNLILTVRGVTACLSALVEKFGGNYARIYRRLVYLGWPPEIAFFAPKSFQYDHSKSKN